jgi:hypothetical protein
VEVVGSNPIRIAKAGGFFKVFVTRAIKPSAPPFSFLSMSDPYDKIKEINRKAKMFIYLITLTNGSVVRIETAGDPTEHPTFFGRVVDVETLGQSGKHLASV